MKILVWSGLVEPNNTRALVYDDGSVMLLCDNPTDAQRVAALSAAVSLLAMMTCRPLRITPGDATLVLKEARTKRETGTPVLDEHRLELIRWACELFAYDAARGTDNVTRFLAAAEIGPDLARRPIMSDPRMTEEVEILRALSSSMSAASLVRDLLVRAGFVAGRVRDEPTLDAFFYDNPTTFEVRTPSITSTLGYMTWTVDAAHVHRLISALAGLAPGDKEGATRAMREVGR